MAKKNNTGAKAIKALRDIPGHKDDVANEFMEIFENCYNKSIPDLQRIQDFQNAYDNMVNPATWPTNTQLPIPLLFTAVEKAIGPVMEYLFPNGTKFFRLNPVERDVDLDRAENAEWSLLHTLTKRMRIAHNSVTTIKNCFKAGIGYGAIEPYVYTPPASFVAQAFSEGQKAASKRVMEMGAKGIKIRLAGRRDGAKIARQEKFSAGKVPTSTIRANVDYAEVPALTRKGYVGVKVWIYKE